MSNQIERYFNKCHGLELEPDVNTGNRNNENGILFLVEYFMLDEDDRYINISYDRMFNTVMSNIEVVPGLYNRGGMDDKVAAETGVAKRSLSHDNISSIAAGSYYLGTRHAKDIAVYGLKHLFSYNNRQKGIRFPMNPGNYSIWLALGKTSVLSQIFFLPFYLANFFISINKPKEATSGKLLNFVELYPLRKHFFWGKMYRLFRNKMIQMYGAKPMVELTKIYFKDENHPVRLAAIAFEDKQ